MLDISLFTLDLIRGDTGELGLDMPPENEPEGFGLDMQHQILFNGNISQSTHAAEFKLNMHTLKRILYFMGYLRTTITVTIQFITYVKISTLDLYYL